MKSTRRIALLLDRGLPFVRGVIRGVRAYAANKPNWVLRDGPPRLHLVAHVREWKPHGVIAGLVLRRVARELIRMGTPLVDTAYTLTGLNVATVDVDHQAVGCAAAEYFLDRRFRNFGFLGSETAAYSRAQEAAFRARLARAGYSVSSCYVEYLADLTTVALWKKSAQRTRRWLRQLSKPAAVLCCEDAPARYLADTCRQLGLHVPDDVALLGVGNDELECNLTPPAISSIAVPSERIGYEAAGLLDRLMSGHPPPPQPWLLPPLHVVTRHSTDTMAVDDEIVRAALQYIRDRASAPISVARVAHDIAVGRRLLERRFRSLLGRSVLEEICRVRVQRARELLADTHLPIAAVAAQSGFPSVRRLDVVFRKLTNVTPTEYRRQAQAHQHLTGS